jgi:site-specific recombinase XerD
LCLYSPHSLRATTAARLLELGVDIRKAQEMLGPRHVTTTQIYDKRLAISVFLTLSAPQESKR